MTKPKILLIGTGGTIASVKTENGYHPGISNADFLNFLPQINNFCDIDCIQIMSLDSTNMQPDNWLTMVKTIKENYESYDGFVITHGTDTMAYTAAALSYLIQNSKKPIVLTGAQHSISDPNSDGPKNLLESIIYASDNESCGVQIVFCGKVINGTRGRKFFSKNLNAFQSVNYPVLAEIKDNNIIRLHNRPFSGDLTTYDSINTNVGVLKLVPGIHTDVIHFMLNKYDALLLESFGVGGLPEYGNIYQEIEQATNNGKIIVIGTQVPYDGSDLEIYRVGNILKNKFNVIETLDMTTHTAYAKLMWILGQTKNYAEVRKLFYTPVSDDIRPD